MNSSDAGDIIEIESSTDTESNLNTKNQSEAEDDIDSLNVTNDTSENEAKESEQETSKGAREGTKCFRGRRCKFNKTYRVHWKKTAETKVPKPEKKATGI